MCYFLRDTGIAPARQCGATGRAAGNDLVKADKAKGADRVSRDSGDIRNTYPIAMMESQASKRLSELWSTLDATALPASSIARTLYRYGWLTLTPSMEWFFYVTYRNLSP